MSNELPGLSLKISVDGSGVDKGIKETESKLKAFRTSVNDASAKLLKYGAAASVAGAALSVHIVKESAAAAKEIQNLARVSNTSITEFQKYAFAAKTVGIEQDKMADILKDVNDRVGDFLITGGGPMLDFFETVAPKVGVTIDQFKSLSGPDALGLYVKTLEAANVSQAQMTFFMEAMASDSTLLLPLLQNNSAALKEQAERAEKLGLVLSDVDSEKLVQAGEAMTRAGDLGTRMLQGLSAEAAPVFTAMLNGFEDSIIAAGGFEQYTKNAFNNIISAGAFVADAIQKIEQTFGVSANGIILAASSIDRAFTFDDEKLKQIDAVIDEAGKAIDDLLNQAPAGEAFKKYVEKAQIEGENSGKAFADGLQKALNENQSAEGAAINTKEDNDFIKNLLDRGKTEAEIRKQQKDEELAFLESKYANKLEKDREYFEMKRAIEGSYMADEAALKEQQEQQEAALNARKVSETASMFNNLSSLMNSGSKKQFEIGKKAALASALVTGYAAAVEAYKGGLLVSAGNPAVGAAFAAASLVATNAQIQAIRSQSFGGGSGGGSAGAVTNGSTGALGETTQQRQPVQTIQISGLDPSSLYSGEQFNGLLDRINEASRDGRVLITQ